MNCQTCTTHVATPWMWPLPVRQAVLTLHFYTQSLNPHIFKVSCPTSTSSSSSSSTSSCPFMATKWWWNRAATRMPIGIIRTASSMHPSSDCSTSSRVAQWWNDRKTRNASRPSTTSSAGSSWPNIGWRTTMWKALRWGVVTMVVVDNQWVVGGVFVRAVCMRLFVCSNTMLESLRIVYQQRISCFLWM